MEDLSQGAHWSYLRGRLFSVEMMTLTGLVRTLVLFAIDLESRRVQICGMARHPCGAWMKQVARNLTDGVDGFLAGKRYLLHDRDPLFTQEFRDILRAAGVRCLKLPAHSPDLNAFTERFVLSIKSECLNKLIPLGERHLRLAINDFVDAPLQSEQPFCDLGADVPVVHAGSLRS